MKGKLKGVLGVALTFMLVASLMAFAAPVAAADYEENDWGEWGLPSIGVDTDVGTMAVAPDGTIFAAVFDADTRTWLVQKSEDDGYTWDDTELDDAVDVIVDIAVSPNYDDDETVYVGCADGTVYRLEEAGDGDVTALKTITDNEGIDASDLFSLDVWTDDDDYNWILVGTDIDVFVLKDKRFENWRDQELNEVAFEVAFAPDFDDEIIWAVTEYYDDADDNQWEFLVTSTVSPGQWGQMIGEVGIDLAATPWVDVEVDIGFPDDYDSDPDDGLANLYVGVSSPDIGEVYLIEGVEAPDPSNAIALFADVAGEDPVNIISIAVSGDYGDEVILAGEQETPTVWISDDGGGSWDTVDKSPTGEGMTYVIMEADVVWGGEVFDPDDGMAFASTWGDESAVSRSEDGGQVYNQVGLIDTEIDAILDLGFHPEFPSDSTVMMITQDDDYDTYSLWLTENGDEDEPDYVRVLCGYLTDEPGNFDGEFELVEYSQDADAIYIWGVDDDRDSSIWKSTDDGQTFGKKRSVKDDANIRDWVITDDRTIYAATDEDGFYKTVNSGLSWAGTDVDGAMNDIALSPDFDDDEFICLGGQNGEVLLSDDAGDSFDDTGAALTGDVVFVAFDADYADEDADGYTLIYAGGEGDDIQVGEVADTDDVDWEGLEDDANEAAEAAGCEGLVVAADNALYAIDADDDELDRLLLHEDDSEWEAADDSDLNDPRGLWLTPGTNVLWTIDDDDAELWVLEDTLSGQVTLDSPPDGYSHDREDVIQLAWDEMRDADEYEYEGTESSGLGIDIEPDTTDDTDITVSTSGSAEYDWKVRVAVGEPWHSRWSDEWTFNTALGASPWAPTLYTPGGVWQYSGLDVELMPAFSWESAKNADGYQFVLADNAEFTSPLVNSALSASTNW